MQKRKYFDFKKDKIMWQLIRSFIRNLYRMFNALRYFMYDYKRYLKYSGYKSDFNDDELRNYNSVMVYHGLEKSLSYKERNPNSGWRNAYQLLDLLKYAEKNNSFGYHDIASLQVLEKFINLPRRVWNGQRSRGSLAWEWRRTVDPQVPGSNPGRGTTRILLGGF
jgi:hypothetical protein